MRFPALSEANEPPEGRLSFTLAMVSESPLDRPLFSTLTNFAKWLGILFDATTWCPGVSISLHSPLIPASHPPFSFSPILSSSSNKEAFP